MNSNLFMSKESKLKNKILNLALDLDLGLSVDYLQSSINSIFHKFSIHKTNNQNINHLLNYLEYGPDDEFS